MSRLLGLGLGILILLAGCKKDTGPDSSIHRGSKNGEADGDGFNQGDNDDFANGGASLDNTLDDDLEPRDPSLDAFSDPLNVIRPFEPVLFGFDQYNLQQSQRPKVEEVALFLKKNPKATLVVEGYCDWKGTPEYNKSLGDRRASTVKKYLTDLGCEPNRIEIVSIGDEKSIPDATPEQARTDRCAQFLVIKKP